MNKTASPGRLMAMHRAMFTRLLFPAVGFALGLSSLSAKPKAAPPAPLTAEGQRLEAEFAKTLDALKGVIASSLPKVDERKGKALEDARAAVAAAAAKAEEAAKDLGKIGSGKALVAHAKGKWIGGAEKGIAAAKEKLAKASNDAERAAAEKELADWEKNKKDGEAALAERQAALDEAVRNEANYKKANDAAQAALAKAKEDEAKAAKDLLGSLDSALSGDKLDGKLAQAAIMSHATPRGLAEFAEKDPGHLKLIEALFANPQLMKEMLVAGGASHGKYGEAMKILTDIHHASSKVDEGSFGRLALAVALEHATPIEQSNPKAVTDGPATVDPVKRYLHYEKARIDGELDPAFDSFTAWEYRHVVNCDAPDEILAWGREMLRNYRPDHIRMADYGWRYSAAVKSEVPYGSQNVQFDDPALHNYQNIIRNGGICGRRAFFGRFILRSFGIPTWGVTQKAHAALSHWTPKGWVVNLGAGYSHSWWDKDEVPMSGNQFLMETQARAHGEAYLKVLRAHWISRVLGETAYNDRRKIEGGFWSNVALQQTRMLAATATSLGPLGQELGEANEREQKIASAAVSEADTKVSVKDGVITVPAVAHGKPEGKAAAMLGFGGGMQIHALGGFKAGYEIEVPEAGKYELTARVATVQTGQVFAFSANGAAASEIPVPYTLGMWQETPPVELDLASGKNTVRFELKEGSKGVTVKDFTLRPIR